MFVDSAFVAGFICVLLISVTLVRYGGISMRVFSIPSFLLIVYIATAYLGIVPLYFGWDPLRVAMGVVDRSVIREMFVYSGATLLLMVMGFVFAHQFLGLRAHPIRDPIPRPAYAGERIVFLGLLAICIGVLLLYLAQVPSIALFAALRGDFVEAAVARSAMGNAFAGKYWRYQLFFGPLLLMCCVFYYTDWRESGGRRSRFVLLGALGAAVFASLMAIEKAPIVNVCVALYLSYAVSRGGRYNQPGLKYFAVGLLAGVVAMYLALTGISDAASGLRAFASRVATGGLTPAYFYLEVFPLKIPYLHGASLPNPAGILPFENFGLTTEMALWIHPENQALGLVGSAPTVFWAEVYANFGPLGVLIAPFGVGVVVYGIQHVLAGLPWTPTTVGASIILASHFRELAATGISTYLVDTTLGAVLAVTLVAVSMRTFGDARLVVSRYNRRRAVT